MTQSHSLAGQMRKLVGDTSLAAQLSKQVKEPRAYSLAAQLRRHIAEKSLAFEITKRLQEVRRVEQQSIRSMLEPLQDIRRSLARDCAIERMLEGLAKPPALSEHLARLVAPFPCTRGKDPPVPRHNPPTRRPGGRATVPRHGQPG